MTNGKNVLEFSVPMKVDISSLTDESWVYELIYEHVERSPTMKRFLDKKVKELLDVMAESGEFDKLVDKAVREKIRKIV